MVLLLPAPPFPKFSANSLWRFTVAQYHQMIASGILNEDHPVELLAGLLVKKIPKKPIHSAITQLVRDLLGQMLPTGWFVADQEPITLADSEPEPDLMIVRGNRRHYFHHHPIATDLALVIEVADATLSRDKSLKKRLYAQAGIPIYWIINLVDNQLEIYSQPEKGIYLEVGFHRPGASVPLVLSGREIAQLSVAELFPNLDPY